MWPTLNPPYRDQNTWHEGRSSPQQHTNVLPETANRARDNRQKRRLLKFTVLMQFSISGVIARLYTVAKWTIAGPGIRFCDRSHCHPNDLSGPLAELRPLNRFIGRRYGRGWFSTPTRTWVAPFNLTAYIKIKIKHKQILVSLPIICHNIWESFHKIVTTIPKPSSPPIHFSWLPHLQCIFVFSDTFLLDHLWLVITLQCQEESTNLTSLLSNLLTTNLTYVNNTKLFTIFRKCCQNWQIPKNPKPLFWVLT